MRIFFIYISLFSYIYEVYAQSDSFNKRIDLGNNESAYSIVLADTGYVIAGATNGTGLWRELALVFTDLKGDLQFVKKYEANGRIFPGMSNALTNLKDKGFILSTSIQNQTENFNIDYLMRFDSKGDTLWTKTVGDFSLFYMSTQVKELMDGSLIYLVLTVDPTDTYNRIYLTKLDSNGNQLWHKIFGTGTNHFMGFSLDICHDNGFIIGGQRTIGKYEHPYVLKVDSVGNVQWERTFGSNYSCKYTYCYNGTADVLQLSNGDFFVATTVVKYQTYPGGIDYNQSRFIRLNPQGGIIWDKFYGPEQLYNYMGFPIELEDGSIIIGGQERNGNLVSTIFKLSQTGDSLWWRTYQVPEPENKSNYLRSIKRTKDGGIVGAGFVTQPQDIWIFKVDSMGCEVPLCHVDSTIGINEVVQKDFNLKIYPNPSNGLFNFEYDLQGEAEGYLSIYNTLGAMVRQEKLVEPSGKVQVEVNGTSGSMFFYTIEVRGEIVGKGKLLLVK